MLRDLVKAAIRPLGFDIVKYPPVSPLARELKQLFESRQINLVLDVGACDGGFARFLRNQIGYKGQIISFEPTAASFAMLHEHFSGDPNWKGYNIGISDADTAGTLNTYGERYDFNSILTLRAEGAKSYNIDLSTSSRQVIKLRSIDSLWPEIAGGLQNVRGYLKSDTQGHDPAVLKGASSSLKEIVALQTEVPAVQIYDGMQSMAETIASLANLGYVPYGFHPINKPDTLKGLATEYDVVFVRSEEGVQ